MDDKTRTELEAAAYRKLVEHLRKRTDVQNIDLMNLAGFCRNCLSKWYRAAAEERLEQGGEFELGGAELGTERTEAGVHGVVPGELKVTTNIYLQIPGRFRWGEFFSEKIAPSLCGRTGVVVRRPRRPASAIRAGNEENGPPRPPAGPWRGGWRVATTGCSYV